jgi:sporulation protein YlmC with PRC-barrel domain
MGERQVAVDMGAITFVSDGATADNAADFFLVMNAARADFEAAPAYGMAVDGMAPAADDTAVVAEGATDAAPMREPMMRDGFTVADGEYLTAERLTGANVYDANDEIIGEVGELVLTSEGQVSEAIIDVGGFLGMGEKPVALKLSDIDILRKEGGDDVRIYVSMTKEQLEQMPTFGG